MGILSECLLLLLLVQAMSIFTVHGTGENTAVDNPPPPPDGDLDLSPEQEQIERDEAQEDALDEDWALEDYVEDEETILEFEPQEDTVLNFLEKRGRGKSGGGKCKKPKAKNGRNVKQLNDDYVEWHNYYRCLHGVGKVKYDKSLERVAKANVQMNVNQGGMQHTSNAKYGENLWAMWGGGFGLGAITGQDPVKAWYDEMTNPGYNFNTPTMFSYGTGHFTQVVWAATKKIGCWTAEHPFQGMTRVFTACEYDPPGNMNMRPKAKNVANWRKNVPAPK
ncbi:Golgi-associated plant pathogenesis-related protein 1-like isoform X7 [Amphiura filiformis]|uniref:Golgi-associated plant pathogenesis-related protein 1-like isoform X7 n=1 Tax=Amphiura filiformis TaxID=82378 RepID=UPI003B21A6C2